MNTLCMVMAWLRGHAFLLKGLLLEPGGLPLTTLAPIPLKDAVYHAFHFSSTCFSSSAGENVQDAHRFCFIFLTVPPLPRLPTFWQKKLHTLLCSLPLKPAPLGIHYHFAVATALNMDSNRAWQEPNLKSQPFSAAHPETTLRVGLPGSSCSTPALFHWILFLHPEQWGL